MLYAPILLVTSLAGSAEAAWLGSAQRIVFSSVSFSALYFFNLYPAISRELSKDRVGWERLMASSYRVIAWGSIAIALASTGSMADIEAGHAPLSGYLTVWAVCSITALVAAACLLLTPKDAFRDHA